MSKKYILFTLGHVPLFTEAKNATNNMSYNYTVCCARSPTTIVILCPEINLTSLSLTKDMDRYGKFMVEVVLVPATLPPSATKVVASVFFSVSSEEKFF